MGQIANVEYFYLKCNKELGTNYAAADWGHTEKSNKQAINVEWLVRATNKVYLDIHKPKAKTHANNFGCALLLSPRFKSNISKVVVDTVLVNEVINYLTSLNKLCDNDCACNCLYEWANLITGNVYECRDNFTCTHCACQCAP
jgi:hypothetical protein